MAGSLLPLYDLLATLSVAAPLTPDPLLRYLATGATLPGSPTLRGRTLRLAALTYDTQPVVARRSSTALTPPIVP